MTLRFIFTFFVCVFLTTYGFGQRDNSKRLAELQNSVSLTDTTGWVVGGGVGLDIGQLAFINPKLGSGENRFGLGGALTYFANYTENRLTWTNNISLNMALQKLGSGLIRANSNEKIPFQKSIDEIRLNSKLGFAVAEGSKFNYAVDFGFLSQITPTHISKVDGGNYLKEINILETALSAKLFSPATITFGIGVDYKPSKNWSVYLSPVSYKGIIVGDDDIAALGIHGNPWNSATDYENSDHQVGGLLKVGYAGSLVPKRIAYSSTLALFSNYINNPQNIDVDWVNELSFNIYKGLQLSVLANLFYDDDVLVQLSDKDQVGGVLKDSDGNPILGKRISITQQILLKYIYVF